MLFFGGTSLFACIKERALDINQLAFVARKRSAWQVFDLTQLTVKKHAGAMLTLVLSLYLPLFILLLLCFSVSTASLIFWWLKPVIERPLITFLANQSFAQPISTWACIASLRQLKLADVIRMLTIYRLSPNRIYLAPVEQLEKLTGKRRSNRKNLLLGRCDHKQTFWVFFCVHLEMILTFLLMLIVYNFMPQGTQLDDQLFINNLVTGEGYLEFVYFCCYAVAVVIVMPFFVTGGFLSYLNSRIKLEGWDLELAFKRMVKTKLPMALCAVLFCFQFNFMPDAYAQSAEVEMPTAQLETLPSNARHTTSDAEKTKQAITHLYEEHHWIEKTTSWQPIFDKSKKESSNFDFSWLKSLSFIGNIIGYIVWGLVLIFVAWLAYKVYQRHGDLFFKTKGSSTKKQQKNQTPQVPVFFDEVVQNVAPENLLSLAEQANQAQQHRAALMYLLHFSLYFAEQNSTVKLDKSMSETECQQALLSVLPHQHHALYQGLFSVWIKQAWAHENASSSYISELISGFNQLSLPEQMHE